MVPAAYGVLRSGQMITVILCLENSIEDEHRSNVTRDEGYHYQ